jgi:hypothetical protein
MAGIDLAKVQAVSHAARCLEVLDTLQVTARERWRLALLCVHKNPVKEVIDQGRLRGTFLGQELGNLELVNSAMAGCLPFVPDDQTVRPALKD